MITYLIQSSVIWLASLTVFDVLLRRTSHHRYNRVYLLSTLLMGALLPLYHSAGGVGHMPVLLTRSLLPAAVAEQHIAQAIMPAAHRALLWVDWLAAFYIAGCVLALAMLLREAMVLRRWYRRGVVEDHGTFQLVSTGRNHGPFSVLRCVFISAKSHYSGEELELILQHEGAHIRNLHFIDKALALLTRCLFWAHPLVYLYYRRLMMVHEFEADAALRTQSGNYAAFLIQQAFDGGAAPAIGHSFFHSSLKTRIKMLSKANTHRWYRIARFIALPVVTAFAVLWVTKSAAHNKEQHGNIVTFGANKFEFGLPDMSTRQASGGSSTIFRGKMTPNRTPADDEKQIDSILGTINRLLNDTNGVKAIIDQVPLKMNGEKVYGETEQSVKAGLPATDPSLSAQLAKAAASALSGLPDGEYAFSVRELIIDKNGRVVYYTVDPPVWHMGGNISNNATPPFYQSKSASHIDEELGNLKTQLKNQMEEYRKIQAAHPVPQSVKDQMTADVAHILDNIQLKPASNDGKPVIARADYLTDAFGSSVVMSVKDHKAVGKSAQ